MYVHMVFVCLCVFDRIESPFGGCFGQLGKLLWNRCFGQDRTHWYR